MFAALMALTASSAFAQNVVPPPPPTAAQTGASAADAKVNAKLEARITVAKSRADQEIQRRIAVLNELNGNVQAMTNLSGDIKASIGNRLTTEVANLTALKAKIDADTDIATLKTDIKSIATAYRIFVLVVPQGRIIAASDRITTTAISMTALATKLQKRVSEAQAAGKDVTALSAALADMNAKITDANVQSSAAVSEVASLTLDNGDKTKMASNEQSLKDARGKVKAATQDMQAARKDAGSILNGLKKLNAGGGVSASTTTS